MPIKEAMPLATGGLAKKSAEFVFKKEKVNNSDLPSHKELIVTYHNLRVEDKRELAQTAIENALEQAGIDSILDTEEFPNITKKFSDIEETDDPQVFHKKNKIYIRLNNGEPNTVLIFDSKIGRAGKFSADLENSQGLFHITTQDDLDKARRNPAAVTKFFSKEGAWMRGGDSIKYMNKFEGKKKKTLDEFWEEKDTKRVKGIGGKKREVNRMKAERAQDLWENAGFQEGISDIWATEFETKQKWAEKVAKVRKKDRELSIELGEKLIGPLVDFGAEIPAYLKEQFQRAVRYTVEAGKEVGNLAIEAGKEAGKKAIEAGKAKIAEKIENVDLEEFWNSLKERVTIRPKET